MEVKQVANLLDLFEYFAAVQRPATLAEIARHFGWPRSSTFNLISTLVGRGYLYEPRAKEGYYPSSLWALNAEKADRAAPIPAAFHHLLETLATTTRETAVLAAISGPHALFVATVESPESVRYSAPVGKRVPLHVTATGRALLHQLSDADRSAILRRSQFKQYTPTTLLSVDAVEAEIQRSIRRGYFEGAQEFSPDLGGIALPLTSSKDRRQFALLVGGPTSRVEAKRTIILEAMRREIRVFLPDYETLAMPSAGHEH